MEKAFEESIKQFEEIKGKMDSETKLCLRKVFDYMKEGIR